MRANTSWIVAVAITVAAVAAGCTSTRARIGPQPPEAYQMIGPSRGRACGLHLFGIIPIGVNSRTEAVRYAFEHGMAERPAYEVA